MKQDIYKIDPNFLTGSANAEAFCWHDIQEAPIEIRGLAVREGDVYSRLPLAVASSVSEGVEALSWHTAGGRIRFKTDAKYLAVRVYSRFANMMSHMPLTGSAGIDIYLNGKFYHSARPASDVDGWFEGTFFLPDPVSEVEINLPLYNGICHMLIGLPEGASLEAPRPYRVEKPMVYYGSSITQGGCASRPGNTYQAHLSRWLDTDHINLGFSGNARGEMAMAEYIATLDMSVFVMDYDHNAFSPEHLWKTHEAFFLKIREAHPDLPVIFITRPDAYTNYEYYLMGSNPTEYWQRCREAIYATYQHALDRGDKNVRFIEGTDLFGTEDYDACTVDRCHPNDLGFYRMAQTVLPVLKEVLK